MQWEYKNLYLMMTKHSPFPANVMPLTGRTTQTQKMQKILDISRSIASLVNGDNEEMTHRRRLSEYQVIDFKGDRDDRHASSRRIHHNCSHFIAAQTAKRVDSHRTLNQEQERGGQAYETLQDKASSTMIPRRKDLYDNHIEKYMASNYDNQELIKQYLSNRQGFIQQACKDIEKVIKQDVPTHRASCKKVRKNRSLLPRIEESASHMLQKAVHRNNKGTYQQEMNHLKKSQQLELKERRRQQRVFRHRMHSLQAKLIKFSSPN